MRLFRFNRWPRFSLRTLLVAVALVAVAAGWVGWHVNQVRERNALIEYLWSLEHQNSPNPCWVIRCDKSKIPTIQRYLGARHDWATRLLCNQAMGDEELLARAKSLLPDCEFEVYRMPGSSAESGDASVESQ